MKEWSSSFLGSSNGQDLASMELMLAEVHTQGTDLVEGGCTEDSLHLEGSTDWGSHERILVITEGVLGYSIDGLSVFHMLDCYYGLV